MTPWRGVSPALARALALAVLAIIATAVAVALLAGDAGPSAGDALDAWILPASVVTALAAAVLLRHRR